MKKFQELLPTAENRNKRRKGRAFTLVELIVVITILAILATVGFLTLSGYTDDARSATAAANVRTVYSAILTESTTSGNSPRYYVDHDPAAALSGGIVFVDGGAVALTGGQWGSGGTNYSAGNPRWDRLKMNGDKFRLSAVFGGAGSGVLPGLADMAVAAYDTGAVSIGAFDYVGKAAMTGKSKAVSYFQVAGVSPGTKKASVTGNYAPAGTGAVLGLVDDPTSGSSTGAVVEGASVDYSKTSFSCAGLPANAAYYGGATTYSVPSGTSTTAAYAGAPAANTCQFACTGGNTWNGSACTVSPTYANACTSWVIATSPADAKANLTPWAYLCLIWSNSNHRLVLQRSGGAFAAYSWNGNNYNSTYWTTTDGWSTWNTYSWVGNEWGYYASAYPVSGVSSNSVFHMWDGSWSCGATTVVAYNGNWICTTRWDWSWSNSGDKLVAQMRYLK